MLAAAYFVPVKGLGASEWASIQMSLVCFVQWTVGIVGVSMIVRSLILVIGFLFALLVKVGVAWAGEESLYLSFEQRLAVSYALSTYGKSPDQQLAIAQRAENYFKSMITKTPSVVEVKNFAEFMSHFRGEWPSTQSLDLDLELIEKRGVRPLQSYKASSPRIQKQIDRYIEVQGHDLLKIVVEEVRLSKGVSYAGELLGLMWLLEEGHDLKRDALLLSLNKVGEMIGEQLKQLENVGERIAESSLAQQQDTRMKILLKTMFSEYFGRLGLDSKKLIASSYLGGNLRASELAKFEIMIQNSGPQLQKLLQVVARQADLGPEMVQIFRNLENAVRPVPWVQVEKLLDSEKKNFRFTYFEKKPLGVGTMAQVHRAKLSLGNAIEDVVVRFIKPGIAERVSEDHVILKDVAKILDSHADFRNTGVPQLTPLVEDITTTVRAELSQQDTIARQILAKKRYEKKVLVEALGFKSYLEFHVPALYLSKGESQFMVQEMIFGKKLDKEAGFYKDAIPGLKKSIVEAMAFNWAKEVLFGGGFYHSDLHQGNFMVQLTDPAVRVNILDFGMGGVIPRDMQNNMIFLGAGLELKDPKLVAEAFWRLSEKSRNTLKEAQFYSLVAEKISRIKAGKDPAMTVDLWTSWAMDQGVRLPYEFISLNRGLAIVNKLLQDGGSALDVTKIMKKLAAQEPLSVYNRLIHEAKLSRKDFLRLGWSEVGKIMNSLGGTPAQGVAPLSAPLCSSVFN